MARANIQGTKATDFIRPEDPRPKTGPVYAVNVTNTKIIFSKNQNLPSFSFNPYPASNSIHQVPIELLDTIEFMKLWSTGKIVVSKNPNVAIAHSNIEAEKAEEEEKKQQAIIDSIVEKGASKTFEVETSKEGLPKTKVKK